ncbi:MAG: GNAT family N-acetyltransferase [candidate division Zixibacteria bacterium]|nr:GNAT family N-acetyltransferase [candidate division Zixibacteria bacterium]MBU2624267.1 GNAT family N-acetyltransferase [candidate division Zixibacteria bacterium]
MFENVHLETERLLIRQYAIDDLDGFYDIVSQEEVVKWVGETVRPKDEIAPRFKKMVESYGLNRPDDIVRFSLAVMHKADGRLAGWVGLGPLPINTTETEIYYGFSQDYWGQGIATEAADAMLQHGFETIGLDRIVAITLPDNPASAKVLEKIGMKFRWTVHDLPPDLALLEGVGYFSLTKKEYNQGQDSTKSAIFPQASCAGRIPRSLPSSARAGTLSCTP